MKGAVKHHSRFTPPAGATVKRQNRMRKHVGIGTGKNCPEKKAVEKELGETRLTSLPYLSVAQIALQTKPSCFGLCQSADLSPPKLT